ncbi:MAG TPA: hypothetical protein VE173_10145 [Longimicrobiales bacterium]|nr:hypothetical protein [Longimicrobiales bacterium]
MELDPRSAIVANHYSTMLMAAGRNAEAISVYLLAALEGRSDGSAFARRLAAFPAQVSPDPAPGNLFAIEETPAILVLLGAEDLALDHLEGVAPQTYADPEWVMVLPALRCDPRFRAVAEPRGFVDERVATLCAGNG